MDFTKRDVLELTELMTWENLPSPQREISQLICCYRRELSQDLIKHDVPPSQKFAVTIVDLINLDVQNALENKDNNLCLVPFNHHGKLAHSAMVEIQNFVNKIYEPTTTHLYCLIHRLIALKNCLVRTAQININIHSREQEKAGANHKH